MSFTNRLCINPSLKESELYGIVLSLISDPEFSSGSF